MPYEEVDSTYKRLPSVKTPTKPINIQNGESNNNKFNTHRHDLLYAQFDPAPFSSTPPNDFMNNLKLRIKTYN
jgi:hypothetical protein